MEEVLKRIYERRALQRALLYANFLITAIFTLSGAYLLYLALARSVSAAISTVVSCAVPFVIVSVIRRLLRAPRPIDLYPSLSQVRKKQSYSFPSRHALSSMLIAVHFVSYSLPLAIVLIVLSLLLSALRTLLGYHFVRDVVCGAMLGAVGAILGIIILP